MQYRKDTFNNIFIRLNDDGSTLMIQIEHNFKGVNRVKRVESYMAEDWDLIYNSYQRSDKREFDEAEKLARI